ncbi:tyrosine phosphatase family domain-containing protein [Trichoderma chlorosporum]
MALNILPDNTILPFASETPLTSPQLFPTLLPTHENDLMLENLSFTTAEMKTQNAVDDGTLSDEQAIPRAQRRTAIQQTLTSSTPLRSSAMSRSASDAAVVAITASHLSEYPTAPMEGRPINFGLVVPGVYRSSYPKKEDYAFLKGLKLKTIVTLVKKDEPDHELESFVAANGIQQVVFNMKGTKKEPIPPTTMAAILELVLDRKNYPLMIHCNHGKHRTGCVVAVVRKLSGWGLDSVVDEYTTYASPKVRECDVEYITSFQPSSLEITLIRSVNPENPRFGPLQVRSFMRTLLFTAVVTTIWLVSGSRMAVHRDSMSS